MARVRSDVTGRSNSARTRVYAGFRYSPRKDLDLGFTIGFDDLTHGGSLAPAGFLAFRI